MPIELYRSADLLVRAQTGQPSPFCIVTFDCYTDRRTLDREGFGEGFFVSRAVNAIHVLSRDNDWYLLPDIERALSAAAKAVESFDRVSAYGSSMGAYAAIRLGKLAGATTAIALSPQFSIDPRLVPFEDRWNPDARRLDYEIERRLGLKGFVSSADVFYDPGNRDARHVELFRGCLEVRDIRLPDCGHPVTGFLAEVGLLERAVLEAAQGTLDRAVFEREALEMRGRSPQYYATLASRPAPPQKKLELTRRAYELFANDVGYITRYAQALAVAGREEDAIAKFNEAMGIEPDHMTVLVEVCEFLKSRRRIPAARAVADWLTRLNPGAAPIEMLRATLRRPRLADAQALIRHWLVQASGLPGGRTKPPCATPSPPRGRLRAPPDAGPSRRPASPPAIHSWLRHAATIAGLPRSPVDIVLIGDSLAHQWPAHAWPGRRVLNLGSNGDRTQHLLWRLACLDDGSIDAKSAVLIVGVNNLVCGEDVQSIVEAIGDVVSEIRRVAPRAEIAAISLPPFGPEFRYRDDDRKGLNASLAQIPEVILVGELAGWEPHGTEARCYQPDGVHFTREGYKRLTAATARALEPAAIGDAPQRLFTVRS
jgi:lysophospholipase L1-like esterase/tetratricopeptide (TPR) repeat protein